MKKPMLRNFNQLNDGFPPKTKKAWSCRTNFNLQNSSKLSNKWNSSNGILQWNFQALRLTGPRKIPESIDKYEFLQNVSREPPLKQWARHEIIQLHLSKAETENRSRDRQTRSSQPPLCWWFFKSVLSLNIPLNSMSPIPFHCGSQHLFLGSIIRQTQSIHEGIKSSKLILK